MAGFEGKFALPQGEIKNDQHREGRLVLAAAHNRIADDLERQAAQHREYAVGLTGTVATYEEDKQELVSN